MSDMTREQYETLALDRLAELARSENERIALEAARTLLVHLRLSLPPRHQDTKDNGEAGRGEAVNHALASLPALPGYGSVAAGAVSQEGEGCSRDNSSSSCLGDLVVDKDVERAREHVLRAMDRCAGLLEHENPFVVLRAAREILQHYRHLCRERFKWTAWSEVRERSAKKRRGVAALAKVAGLGRDLAGIRGAIDREENSEGAEEYRVCPPPPIDWDATQEGPSGSASHEEGEGSPPDPDERAPP